MLILGLQKTTLLDYPGHIASTIFTGGCNFRCPYCHNADLVLTPGAINAYDNEVIFSHLKKRVGIIDGVCITGGEPTLYKELPDFIDAIKSIKKHNSDESLLVKLDTNGTNPNMLEYLINNKKIDYVAMDIKSSIENYSVVAGILADNEIEKSKYKGLIDNVVKSIEILKLSNIEYEFRTTIIKEYHDEKTIHGIGELIRGADKYYIQSFIDSEYVPNHSLSACDKETLTKYLDIMSKYVKLAELRGVD